MPTLRWFHWMGYAVLVITMSAAITVKTLNGQCPSPGMGHLSTHGCCSSGFCGCDSPNGCRDEQCYDDNYQYYTVGGCIGLGACLSSYPQYCTW